MSGFDVDNLKNPKDFYTAFKNTWDDCKPPWKNDFVLRDAEWTNWFERSMRRLVEQAARGIHCQNRFGGAEEWMKVDHVFVLKNAYDSFPIIAVEHENGSLGSPDNELADPEGKAAIEWALWKVLSMRSHLAVLVAYPGSKKENRTIEVAEQMLAAWQQEYSPKTKVLILLGPASGTAQLGGPFYRSLEWDAAEKRLKQKNWD